MHACIDYQFDNLHIRETLISRGPMARLIGRRVECLINSQHTCSKPGNRYSKIQVEKPTSL